MRNDLIDIREKITAGRFVNEAAISQGIVLRLLHALSWPAYDTNVVSPEFSLQGRRVDYALCHPPGTPLVFIEVKQLGQSEGADLQLFEYAFHKGVPMAVLTDGREWHFYLPAEQGSYTERRVYKLDILERDIDESAERLRRYLDYGAICSGAAIKDARRDYEDVAKERKIGSALPEVWRKLLAEPDAALLELIADKVESLCGYRPESDVVAAFIARSGRIQVSVPSTLPSGTPRAPVRVPPRPAQLVTASSAVGYTIDGQFFPARNFQDILLKVLQHFATSDPTFLERFAALPKHGVKVRYLARDWHKLNPGASNPKSQARELVPGWWVYVKLGQPGIAAVIKLACEVTNMRYGHDIRLHFG